MMQADYFFKIPLDTILAVISLAIAIGGFIPIFFMHDRKKEIALTMVLATLIVLSGITYIRGHQHQQRVKSVSVEIVEKLGVDCRTFDQLYEQLYYPDFLILSEALENLIKDGQVGHKILEVRDDRGENYRVKVYYLRSK